MGMDDVAGFHPIPFKIFHKLISIPTNDTRDYKWN